MISTDYGFFYITGGDSEDQGRLLVATLMSKQQFTSKYLVICIDVDVSCYPIIESVLLSNKNLCPICIREIVYTS